MKELAMLIVSLLFALVLVVVGVAAAKLSSDATAVILTLVGVGVLGIPFALVIVGGMFASAQQRQHNEYTTYLRERAELADQRYSQYQLQARKQRQALPPPAEPRVEQRGRFGPRTVTYNLHTPEQIDVDDYDYPIWG